MCITTLIFLYILSMLRKAKTKTQEVSHSHIVTSTRARENHKKQVSREENMDEDLDISIDAEVDDFLSSLDPELLKDVDMEMEEEKHEEEKSVQIKDDEDDAAKTLDEESNVHNERENELNERERKLRDLLKKLQRKQIALHEREQNLEQREMDINRRERLIQNEASRMKAKEKVVMDGLGRAASQEANLKRWLDELQKTKTNLKCAEVEWLRRTQAKAAEKTGEKKNNANDATSSPSASELLKNTPRLQVDEDSPDSDRDIHMSCVNLKSVASFLTQVFERTNDISEQVAITCDTMSKLTTLLREIKLQDTDNVVNRMLGSCSLNELKRFSNSVLQLHQFFELLGHSLSQAVARPLADIVHNTIEDALALHLRLQEDRGLLDDATERFLNTRLVKGRERDGVVGYALQNLFGATNLVSNGGNHAISKSAMQTLEYQWTLRRFDAIAASNLAAKHARVRVAEVAASGLLAMEAFVTQTSSSLSNVAQVAAPLLSSCQSATMILTSSSQRNRVEREQLQAETTWKTNYKNKDSAAVEKRKAPTPVKTNLSEIECVRKGYLRLRTRSKGLGKRCWFDITSKGIMRYRKHWREPVKPLVDLLLCAIRSCDDFEEPFPFIFEIHTPQKRYCFQARSDEERRSWVKTLRNAASSRLATHTKSQTKSDSTDTSLEEKESSTAKIVVPKLSPAQIRQKNLLDDLKSRLKKLNPKCADCGEKNPEWVCLNLGVMCCHQCAGIHRSLELAFVRSLELDTINPLELRMMESCGGNEKANKIWQSQSQTGWNAPVPDSDMKERKRWIEAKYMWAGFTKSSDESRVQWSESLKNAAAKGDLFVVLECLARRHHVIKDSSSEKGPSSSSAAIDAALHVSRDGGHILCERLLMMYQ